MENPTGRYMYAVVFPVLNAGAGISLINSINDDFSTIKFCGSQISTQIVRQTLARPARHCII